MHSLGTNPSFNPQTTPRFREDMPCGPKSNVHSFLQYSYYTLRHVFVLPNKHLNQDLGRAPRPFAAQTHLTMSRVLGRVSRDPQIVSARRTVRALVLNQSRNGMGSVIAQIGIRTVIRTNPEIARAVSVNSPYVANVRPRLGHILEKGKAARLVRKVTRTAFNAVCNTLVEALLGFFGSLLGDSREEVNDVGV